MACEPGCANPAWNRVLGDGAALIGRDDRGGLTGEEIQRFIAGATVGASTV
jgi:hypothetical protein